MDRSAEVVEYVGGPRNGMAEERSVLPASIPAPGGRYVRSVRCADDGAMRYVWHRSDPADQSLETEIKER